MDTEDPATTEFGVVAEWTVEAARSLGPHSYEPAGCRGSGNPVWLDWFAERLEVRAGLPVLDVGAGVGGAAGWLARTRGAAPLLVEPQPAACAAARDLFALPVVRADATRLPVPSATFAAAWSLGVLDTESEVSDQRAQLRELHRVLRPGGRAGLLVLVARRARVPDPPEGNNFPSDARLDDAIDAAGLRRLDAVDTADLPDPPDPWAQAERAVDDELERRHGDDPRWQLAAERSGRLGALLADGVLATRLVVVVRDGPVAA